MSIKLEVSEFDRQSQYFEDQNYYLICHASYEQRSLAVCDIPFSNAQISNAIIVSSEEYIEEPIYKENTKRLYEHLNSMLGVMPKSVVVKKDEPIDFLKKVESDLGVKRLDIQPKFLVDTSTFPRDRLISLIDYLFKVKTPQNDIELIYTSPDSYDTEKEEGWLTKGVSKIISIPRFNGKQKTRKKSLLIMLLGHESERAHITLRNIEPDKVIFVMQGEHQVNLESKMTSDYRNKTLIDDYAHQCLEIKRVSYSNPSETDQVLEEIYGTYKHDYNLIVSVNGTKMQALGAMLTCMRHREIQIIYSYPQVYNVTDYSTNVGQTFHGRFIASKSN